MIGIPSCDNTRYWFYDYANDRDIDIPWYWDYDSNNWDIIGMITLPCRHRMFTKNGISMITSG